MKIEWRIFRVSRNCSKNIHRRTQDEQKWKRVEEHTTHIQQLIQQWDVVKRAQRTACWKVCVFICIETCCAFATKSKITITRKRRNKHLSTRAAIVRMNEIKKYRRSLSCWSIVHELLAARHWFHLISLFPSFSWFFHTIPVKLIKFSVLRC